ncbi:EAL and HDOD domain-containing protein [Propionivibrio dicarboxylicus]|uniref:EAL and modified HD-GYP domain-containing signal transduction protein n=1 Tax=Propionivibrio dicarboxylicus TaxID=83767 RepID=A0A1G8JD00_9RHOO|nr:HDOD domain-containing protein [Propionivibrio dicarboxylicus]SDI29154.1 EAL and modified HD-GYP domain-containing signal transduction protein [Propionivibrio dicarboxylicus]
MRLTYFFFRPLVSAAHGWVAFDLGTRLEEKLGSQDIVRCLREANAGSLASVHPLIIASKPAWLEQAELREALKPNQAIFMLPPAALDDEKVLATSKALLADGYHIGITIADKDMVRRVPRLSFDHVAMTAALARDELTTSGSGYFSDLGFRKIATEVTTHEMYGWISAHDFAASHCGFLAERNPAGGRQPDLARLKLLKLLSIVEHDGDTREIESIFREEPKLSYNLLRLVNSVAVGARTRISNFSQAIAILGRRQLQRWLQLLIYANNLAEGNHPNPLMQLAATRGRLIELLCKSINSPSGTAERCDNAFMTGLFSLLDVLLNMPMPEILKELPLQEEVVAALADPENGGILGKLLSIVAHTEKGQFGRASLLLDELDISPDTHAAAQVLALHWAARINIDSN